MKIHVKIAFVGTDGFSAEYGTTTHLIEGAEIVRKMCAQADRTVLVADSSKYGRKGFAHVLDLDQLSLIITDGRIHSDARDAIEEAGVELYCVDTKG